MAIPKGLPSRYSTSTMASSMMENPMYQKMLRDATSGKDNRAISNESQVMGKMIAGEQKRRMGLDEVGRDLAMRKDTLAFQRKAQDFKESNFQTNLKQRRAEMAQHDKQFRKELEFKSDAAENDYAGLEMGLGLLSTSAEIFGAYTGAKQHNKLLTAIRNSAPQKAGIKFDYTKTATQGQDDEDPMPIEYRY
jgi:hypothetical protein